MLRMHQRFGLILIVIAILIVGGVLYVNSAARQSQPVFSDNAQLSALWKVSKTNTLDATSGRTIDKTQKNLTTSEGESYTLLRAVWNDDRTTFDKSLGFTNDNLRRTDGLFAWRYGDLGGGKYGILTAEGGDNTASDADADIAMALSFAATRWQDEKYLAQARATVQAIWTQEVVTIQGKPYVVSNNLEKDNPSTVLINPSYLSPAAYRIFAKIDKLHDWNAVLDSSYTLLDRVTNKTLAGQLSVGLPPDWIIMDRKTSVLTAPTATNITTNYSYDAMRTPFRLTLDYEWNQEPRAKAVLSKMSFLGQQWTKNQVIKAGYSQGGAVSADYESPAIYGASSAYFKVIDTANYEALYKTKLQVLYSANTQSWKDQLQYYDDNWVWFAMALHDNYLTDLTRT